MIDINNEARLRELYKRYEPKGSGPLALMRIICELIEGIAEEKGFDLEEPKNDG